ncbi:hypothetical protein SprV_0100365600 [Sparganum proliferum]
MLTNVPGAIAYLDDILVVGSSEDELGQKLDQVVHKLIDYGLKINVEKREFLPKEIHYPRLIVNENGCAPGPERVKAFRNMKLPKNAKELQSFMGLVSNYAPFITGLLCKDGEFVWSPECQKAFDAIKTKICGSTMLLHFEADKETVVQADDSDYGLGGVLLQKDADGRIQPTMHAIRETKFATIISVYSPSPTNGFNEAKEKFYNLYALLATVLNADKPVALVDSSVRFGAGHADRESWVPMVSSAATITASCEPARKTAPS